MLGVLLLLVLRLLLQLLLVVVVLLLLLLLLLLSLRVRLFSSEPLFGWRGTLGLWGGDHTRSILGQCSSGKGRRSPQIMAFR